MPFRLTPIAEATQLSEEVTHYHWAAHGACGLR
jgi:hypothetical protein